MASTSTNKQPLLVDRVFHKVTDMKGGTIGKNDRVDLSSTNNAKLLLDCTTTDGAVVAEIYTLARDTTGNTGNITPWIINFYMTIYNERFSPSTGAKPGGRKIFLKPHCSHIHHLYER